MDLKVLGLGGLAAVTVGGGAWYLATPARVVEDVEVVRRDWFVDLQVEQQNSYTEEGWTLPGRADKLYQEWRYKRTDCYNITDDDDTIIGKDCDDVYAWWYTYVDWNVVGTYSTTGEIHADPHPYLPNPPIAHNQRYGLNFNRYTATVVLDGNQIPLQINSELKWRSLPPTIDVGYGRVSGQPYYLEK